MTDEQPEPKPKRVADATLDELAAIVKREMLGTLGERRNSNVGQLMQDVKHFRADLAEWNTWKDSVDTWRKSIVTSIDTLVGRLDKASEKFSKMQSSLAEQDTLLHDLRKGLPDG